MISTIAPALIARSTITITARRMLPAWLPPSGLKSSWNAVAKSSADRMPSSAVRCRGETRRERDAGGASSSVRCDHDGGEVSSRGAGEGSRRGDGDGLRFGTVAAGPRTALLTSSTAATATAAGASEGASGAGEGADG